MNVLHEIGTKLWVSLFRQIKDCLRSDGVLIFAEAKVLSIGEQPYCENGYIVLGEKQIRILFKKNEYDSQIAAFHADFGKKEKSEFIIIPADELSNISETNIKNALENLEEETFVTLNNMNEERVRCIRESKKPSFTYRKYAFVAQQYINAKIVIEKYYSPIALNMQITEAWKENI